MTATFDLPTFKRTTRPCESAHRALARYNHVRLEPTIPSANDYGALVGALSHSRSELELLAADRAAISALAATAPSEPEAFVRWFEGLAETGPGQGDRLFPWLATEASAGEMCWFLYQEVAGEAGFDDLVALAQVKLPPRAKLEMARNYWDEMGQGNAKGTHGGMLAELSDELGLHPTTDDVVWEAVALGNLMLAMATHRPWAFHCIGALGAIELTAPTRVGLVHDGLVRLGLAPRGRKYFALHATLDLKHSEAWNREVLAGLLAWREEVAPALAQGALMRLAAGQRCFERYRHELDIDGARPLRDWRPPNVALLS